MQSISIALSAVISRVIVHAVL